MDLDLVLARGGTATNRAQCLHETELRMMLHRRFSVSLITKPPARLAADDAQVHDQLIAVKGLRVDAAHNDVPQGFTIQRVFHERAEFLEAKVPPYAGTKLGVAAHLRRKIIDAVHQRERHQHRRCKVRDSKSGFTAQPTQSVGALLRLENRKQGTEARRPAKERHCQQLSLQLPAS